MAAHNMAILCFPKLSKCSGIFLIHLLLLFLCYIHKSSKSDQWGVTIVLLVSDWTSAVASVFHWVWDAALGLWAAACLGVVGATDGCAVGAVGICCTASEVGVVTGWHFNLGVHVRLDSICMMFMNVVSFSSVLSSTNDFDNVGAMIGCMYYSGKEPQVSCHCLI